MQKGKKINEKRQTKIKEYTEPSCYTSPNALKESVIVEN